MNNKYVSVRCPSCSSNIQMKAKSMRSDVFYCPVCETGEIRNPDASLIIHVHKVGVSTKQPMLVMA